MPKTPKVLQLPSTLSTNDQELLRLDLEQKQLELEKSNTTSKVYVIDKVQEHKELWWEVIRKAMESPDENQRKWAAIEYNKLQVRLIGTDIDQGNTKNVSVTVLSFSRDKLKELRNTYDESKGFIDGEVVE